MCSGISRIRRGEHVRFNPGDFFNVDPPDLLDASYRIVDLKFPFGEKVLGVRRWDFFVPDEWGRSGASDEGNFCGRGEGWESPPPFLNRV